LKFSRSIFLSLLNNWVLNYPASLTASSDRITGIIPSITLLPASEIEDIISPILNLCDRSSSIFGCVLSFCRKFLLQKDINKKILGVSFLCKLLATNIGPDQQKEILHAIMHVFTLPSICRRTLYHQIFNILITPTHSNFNQIILDIFSMINEKNLQLLHQLFISSDYLSEKHAKCSLFDKILSTKNTTESVQSINGKKYFLTEDIISLLSLSWSIEMNLKKEVSRNLIEFSLERILCEQYDQDNYEYLFTNGFFFNNF